ncbi:MAG: Ig-like domain-containing protein [Planctomycetaceae bacterium]|nr:Ig-like domain-containing protein [Planctomycetaceae bacterium]
MKFEKELFCAAISGLLLGLLFFAGCGQNSIRVEKVTGTVTLDKKPVADVTVSFHPKDNNLRAAIGRTNEKGEFDMATGGAKNDGAMSGDYFVTFSKYILVTQNGVEAEPFVMNADGSPPPERELTKKYLIPEKYRDSQKPLFEVKVERGKNNKYTFDLQSE